MELADTIATVTCTVAVTFVVEREIEYDRTLYAESGLELHEFLAKQIADDDPFKGSEFGYDTRSVVIEGPITEEVPAR